MARVTPGLPTIMVISIYFVLTPYRCPIASGVAVLLGNGDGTFQSARLHAAGRNYDLLYGLKRSADLFDRGWRIRPLGGQQRNKLDLPMNRDQVICQKRAVLETWPLRAEWSSALVL